MSQNDHNTSSPYGDLPEIAPRPEGRLRRMEWEEGTYQDVSGHRYKCWMSAERIHGLKLHILDTRELEAPILISGHAFDISKVPNEERPAKAFLLINATTTRPKVEIPISLHPTRGEAQERAERVYARSVLQLFNDGSELEAKPGQAAKKGFGNLIGIFR